MTDVMRERSLAKENLFEEVSPNKYRDIVQSRHCGQEVHIWKDITSLWKKGHFVRGEYLDVKEFSSFEDALFA